jgi:hypothetical protein
MQGKESVKRPITKGDAARHQVNRNGRLSGFWPQLGRTDARRLGPVTFEFKAPQPLETAGPSQLSDAALEKVASATFFCARSS